MKKMNFLIAMALIFTFGSIYAQNYKVKSDASILEWTGKKVTGEHTGTLKLKSGEFVFKEDNIVSGEFVIDMKTIVCTDLKNEEYNKKLVGHLKSDDFFGVENYPTAQFVLKRSEKLANNDYSIYGDLTIKGITHPLEFKVSKLKTNDGLIFKGSVVVDRTNYNIRYGSGKFFDSLGDNLIYDDFTVELNIMAIL